MDELWVWHDKNHTEPDVKQAFGIGILPDIIEKRNSVFAYTQKKKIMNCVLVV